MNEFEKKLQEQKFRPMPEEWRREILSTLPSAGSAERPRFLARLNGYVTALLWPNPKAWAAMATIWIGLLVIGATNNSDSTQMTKDAGPRPVEYLRALQEQRQILALLFNEALPPAESPKSDRPRPRTEYIPQTATV
jgi:hypothetical protein